MAKIRDAAKEAEVSPERLELPEGGHVRPIFVSERDLDKLLLLLVLIVFGCLFLTSSRRAAAFGGRDVVMPSPSYLETSFAIPGLTGNPFDYTQNDVQVTFRQPDAKAAVVPAFFDGDTWRARVAPTLPGEYVVAAVTRNGKPATLSVAAQPARFRVTAADIRAASGHGFVRLDPHDRTRFAFADGTIYYPIGADAAWGKGGDDADLLRTLTDLATRGHANWARVWMNHWDGKNLDWETGKAGHFDQIDLVAARRWDRIVETANANGLYLQVTLQHHGPYSTRTDSNWNENPWNRGNGGFLDKPGAFFTDPRARALTRAKYRYIIARYGYSPHILAWELWNEVQWVDPIHDGQLASVVAWHREMADFLRQQDPNHHLITTSSDTGIPGLYDAVDYIQPHTYPADIVSAVTAPDRVYRGKPYFFGEFGASGKASDAESEAVFHDGLWASLTTPAGGAAQFWYWDQIERADFFPVLRSASDFAHLVGADALTRMQPIAVQVSTPDTPVGSVSAGPGGGWGKAARTDLTIHGDGTFDGIAGLPSFLQGRNHQEMFPYADFHVDYGTRPGTFAVAIGQVSKAGGHLTLSVDGKRVAERDFPARAADRAVDETVTAAVPPGAHIVRVANTGQDWVVVNRFTLAPYGAALRVLAKGDSGHALLWVRSTNPASAMPEHGTIAVPGLASGAYRVVWWDTEAGKEIRTDKVTVAGGTLTLGVPHGVRDMAGWVSASAR